MRQIDCTPFAPQLGCASAMQAPSPSPSPNAASPPDGEQSASAAPRSPLQQRTEYDIHIRTISLSGQFIIKRLHDSKPVFKLKRQNLSAHDVRRLYDMNDVALYKMTNVSLVDLRHRARIVDEISGRCVFVLRREGYLPGIGGNTIVAWKGDSEEGDPYLRVTTAILRRHFTVTEHATGKLVCEARRENIGRFVFFAIAVDTNYHDHPTGNTAAASSYHSSITPVLRASLRCLQSMYLA